jgi:hypothetical protein
MMLMRNSTSGYKIGLAMDDQMRSSERVCMMAIS